MYTGVIIHPTAEVSPHCSIGTGTRICSGSQIREGARIGANCTVGRNVYIEDGVHVGSRCEIQNNASLFHGSTLEDGVFIGPHACLTNDRVPRAMAPQGEHLSADDAKGGTIVLRHGSSIGAGALVLSGVNVGRYALVGAGAVVTRSVLGHCLVMGNPARPAGFVCACGGRLRFDDSTHERLLLSFGLRGEELGLDATAQARCTICEKLVALNWRDEH